MVQSIAILKGGGWTRPKNATGTQIAKEFLKAIDDAKTKLLPKLDKDLRRLHTEFVQLKDNRRHKLLHSRPHTAPSGEQHLGGIVIDGKLFEWTPESIYAAAMEFEEASIRLVDLIHGDLKKACPW